MYSSEEVDVVGFGEAVDSPPQSLHCEELMEVVTLAVAKLNIERPAEQQAELPRRKLDECFLHSRLLPPCLLFFSDLHTEMSTSWARPFSACIISPTATHYSNVMGLNEHGDAPG